MYKYIELQTMSEITNTAKNEKIYIKFLKKYELFDEISTLSLKNIKNGPKFFKKVKIDIQPINLHTFVSDIINGKKLYIYRDDEFINYCFADSRTKYEIIKAWNDYDFYTEQQLIDHGLTPVKGGIING